MQLKLKNNILLHENMIKYISVICLFVGYVFIHTYLNYTAQQNAILFYNERINNK